MSNAAAILGPILGPATGARVPVSTPAATTSGSLRAPLYVAWQVTNECNLACLHCIEESDPGKAFADEMTDAQLFGVLDQIIAHDVPYMSFSGGEPMLQSPSISPTSWVPRASTPAAPCTPAMR
jgi:hypothetical protein